MAEGNNPLYSEIVEPLFREVQRFSLLLRLAVTTAMTVTVVLESLVLGKILTSDVIEVLAVVLLVIFGILLPTGMAVLFMALRLETEVRPDGLYVRFFPIHLNFRKFAVEDLKEYYARTYKPISEFGGWGVRCGWRGGKAYNVSGNKGVQLVLGDDKHVLIGSQRPDELVAAIASVARKSGLPHRGLPSQGS
jgi:hypothetical protein